MARGPSVRPKVYEVLHRNLGIHTSMDQITRETGFTPKQVSDAIGGLRRDQKLQIDTVIPGGVYVLRTDRHREPEPAAPAARSKRIFQEIGAMRDGTLILQDQDDKIYKAEEL